MKRYFRPLAAFLLSAALLCGSFPAAAEKPERVTPVESFYGYVNQDWFASFDSGIEGAYVEPVFGELICPDPETLYEYDNSLKIQEETDEAAAEVKAALFSGRMKTEPGSPGRKILDLYDCLKNQEADREADDARFLEYVRPFLEADDPETFIRAAAELYSGTGINVLFEITAGEEKETNSELPVVRFAAPADGARVAYDPESAALFAPEYREAMGDYMRALGWPVPGRAIEEAFRLQALNASGQKLYMEYRNARFSRSMSPDSGYTARDTDLARILELHPDADPRVPEGLSPGDAAVYQALVSFGLIGHNAFSMSEPDGFPMLPVLSRMLETAGFRCNQVIILPENLEALKTETLTDDNLDAWRINAAVLISEKLDYAPAAAADAVRRMHRAAGCALWGDGAAPETAAESRDDEALQDRALKLLPMEYALLWAEENYDPAMTGKAQEMVDRIRAAYLARLRKTPWLGEAEREACVRKLENMEAVIGLPSEENYVFAEILSRAEGGSLLVNRVRFLKRDLARNLRLVNEEGYARIAFDQELFHQGFRMDLSKVNAGANMGYNSIILPAWFLTYAVNPDADETELLATLGAFVAHEMGHNFDQNGAMYDENGALRNLWSEETYEELSRIRDRFEKHFEQAEVISGISRSFQGEMGECFADFSGITLVLDLIGDDPDAQRHALESWASSKAFRFVISRAQMELKIDFDMFTSHPTGAQRINGIISALDVFYALYDVKEGDPMYTAPEDRLSLW